MTLPLRYFNNGVFNYADTIDQQKQFNGRSTTLGVQKLPIQNLLLNTAWMLVLDYAFTTITIPIKAPY